MGDFYEENYYIDNIGDVAVYSVNDSGQLVKSGQKVCVRLVIKVEERPWTMMAKDSWVLHVHHPLALVLDVKGLTDKNDWIVDIQEIIQLNNEGWEVNIKERKNSGPLISIDPIVERDWIGRSGPSEFNQYTLEAISDLQPDYDADFVTISTEGNGLKPIHGPISNNQSAYLSFSAKNLSISTWDSLSIAENVSVSSFNQMLKNIDQDNLTVALKSKYAASVHANSWIYSGRDFSMIAYELRSGAIDSRSYKIPVLMTK